MSECIRKRLIEEIAKQKWIRESFKIVPKYG